MRLFIFEGEKREPIIFNSLLDLYFSTNKGNGDIVFFTYNHSIHQLYKELKDNEMSLFRVLQDKEKNREEKTLANYIEDDITEMFLFFDYDFHNKQIELDKWNTEIKDMLMYFCEETLNGKLYISYPMVEAIRYTKKLPDNRYCLYTISRQNCIDIPFKKISYAFSCDSYPDMDFILSNGRAYSKDEVKNNWELLKFQNVKKANYIVNSVNDIPINKTDISQDKIFNSQLLKFVNTQNCEVSILSAFPIFLWDYFRQI